MPKKQNFDMLKVLESVLKKTCGKGSLDDKPEKYFAWLGAITRVENVIRVMEELKTIEGGQSSEMLGVLQGLKVLASKYGENL